jgi:hypothetical protein
MLKSVYHMKSGAKPNRHLCPAQTVLRVLMRVSSARPVDYRVLDEALSLGIRVRSRAPLRNTPVIEA